MKKVVIVLSLGILSLVSCSKDSGEPTTPPEPIIGKWKVIKVGNSKPDKCFIKSSLTFSSNGTSISDFFTFNDEKDCKQKTINSTWTKVSDNKYKVKYQGKEDILNVKFKENNTIMELETLTFKKE